MTSEDWLRYRKRGIGASEVGTIMGLDQYKASIQLFYEKIGEDLGFSTENLSMFLGKEQEPFIAELWEYWEGNETQMMANYRMGQKVRRCKRVKAYAHNEKWPWLFVSLDREINQHAGRSNGALELKTIGGYESDKWEAGIPPKYITQVQTQMLVCGYEYGEIAVLKDNREFFVYPFEFSKSITDSIIEITKSFWDKVEKARIIITQQFEAKRNFNYAAAEDLQGQLQALEPEPDGSDAFHSFLKEKYHIAIPGERIGTDQQLITAQKHKEINDRIKELGEEKQLYENQLKNDFGHQEADRLDFGDKGNVTWKGNKNGVRVFLNKVKI